MKAYARILAVAVMLTTAIVVMGCNFPAPPDQSGGVSAIKTKPAAERWHECGMVTRTTSTQSGPTSPILGSKRRTGCGVTTATRTNTGSPANPFQV